MVVVNTGHAFKNPFLVALIHVDRTGLNAAACKNPMSLEMVLESYAPLEVGVRGFMHSHYICGSRLNLHRPVILSHHPVKIVFPS